MKPLRSVLLATLALTALMLSAACQSFDPDSPSRDIANHPVPSSSPLETPKPSSSPTESVKSLCGQFDYDFSVLIGEPAVAATGELRKNYANPGPAVEKLKAILLEYAARLEHSQAGTNDQQWVKAFADEAQGSRITIRLLESMLPEGEQIHIMWTRYFLHTGKDFLKLCPAGTLTKYHSIDEIRASWK